MGLFQGLPDEIPVADTDFIFAAISEEMGLILSLCLILVCVSCYVMFLNIALALRNQFYKLVALGLGTCYIFQVFLNIGGVDKIYTFYRRNSSSCQLRRKLNFKYDDHVRHHTGSVYFKRR